MMPATVPDQTNAIYVRQRDRTIRRPKLLGKGNRVAPTLLTINANNSVPEHGFTHGSGHDHTRGRLPRHPGMSAPVGVVSTDSHCQPATTLLGGGRTRESLYTQPRHPQTRLA